MQIWLNGPGLTSDPAWACWRVWVLEWVWSTPNGAKWHLCFYSRLIWGRPHKTQKPEVQVEDKWFGPCERKKKIIIYNKKKRDIFQSCWVTPLGIQTRRFNANASHQRCRVSPIQAHGLAHSVPRQMLPPGPPALYLLPSRLQTPSSQQHCFSPRKVLPFSPVPNMKASRKWRTSLPHKIILEKTQWTLFSITLEATGGIGSHLTLQWSSIPPGRNGCIEWVSAYPDPLIYTNAHAVISTLPSHRNCFITSSK